MSYLLQMGYWTDLMEAQGEGPDVFFMAFSVDIGDDPAVVLDDVLAVIEMLREACHDKYGREPHHADTYWSCAPGD